MNYAIDFFSYVIGLVPLKIRGPKFQSWVGALVSPLQSLNSKLYSKVVSVRYLLSFTGQVIYLEHRLNDEFDPTNRSIFIDDPTQAGIIQIFVFNKIENQVDAVIYNKAESIPTGFVFNQIEYTSEVDFIVNVPAINFSDFIESVMRKVIETYKQAGRRYSFKTF